MSPPAGRSIPRRPVGLVAPLAAAAALGLLLAATLVAGAPVARGVTIDPCVISPSECATLTISPTGDGYGFVESTNKNGSSDGFISCAEGAGYVTGTCSHRYFIGSGPASPKTIYLYVAPQPGSERCDIFGNCAVTPILGTASLESGVDRTITEDFELTNPARVRVGTSGTGSGSITSQPIGIDCGTRCHWDFNVGTSLTLTVNPDPGSTFRGWSTGPCQGQGPACTFTIPQYDLTITAEVVGPAPTPSPTPKPTPTPKATAKPAATAQPSASAIPATTESPTESLTEFPAATPPGVTAAPPGSNSTATPDTAGPSAQPTTPGAVGPTGASGGSDLTPLALSVVFVGVLIAGAVFFGLRRRPAA